MIPDINSVVSLLTLLRWSYGSVKSHSIRPWNVGKRLKDKALMINFWERYREVDPGPTVMMSAEEGIREAGEPDKIVHDIRSSLRLLDSLGSTCNENGGNILNRTQIKFDGKSLNVDEQRSHIMTIGGPKVNDVTAEVLQSYPNGYGFEGPDNRRIIDKASNNYFDPTAPSKDGWEDLALVAHVPNPMETLESTSDVIVVCGSYGYGTVGAAEFFDQPRLLKEVYSTEDRYFQAILRINVNRFRNISGIEFEDRKLDVEKDND